jgi:alpha-amylase
MVPRIIHGLSLFFFIVLCVPVSGQGGFGDDRVMLQGFYWESYRHGYPDRFPRFGEKRWYEIVKDNADRIRGARFDLVWLPPPSFAGQFSAGYNPKELFKLENSYGSFDQHREMLEELLRKGIEPVADVVINHRDGLTGWADFKNPAWGPWAVCRTDEAFNSDESGIKDTPEDERGAPEEKPSEYTTHGGTTYQYDGFRDIDHTDSRVRRDILRYLLQLKSAGYRGWRYDMVHGYHARWVALYNKRSQPTFSVGEFDWGAHGAQRGWAWHTAVRPGRFETSSSVFDFSTLFSLKNDKNNYLRLYGFGKGLGLVGDSTDEVPWREKAVTFLENHDTGYRTEENGEPQEHHEFDSFANNWEVEQGYAYILTHPGLPTVYWKHFFDWGGVLRDKITGLINARKIAGVHSGSSLHLQDNARQRGIYAAMIQGTKGELYVRIGGNDSDWMPHFSNYQNYREYVHGAGWTVWVKLPGNPQVQFAPLKREFPIPDYREASDIDIPDAWLN